MLPVTKGFNELMINITRKSECFLCTTCLVVSPVGSHNVCYPLRRMNAFHDKNVVFLISFLLSWIWRLITVCTLNVCLQCEDINNRLLMELWTLVPGIEYLLSTVNASIYNLVNTGYTLVCGWIVELAYDISMYVVPKQPASENASSFRISWKSRYNVSCSAGMSWTRDWIDVITIIIGF